MRFRLLAFFAILLIFATGYSKHSFSQKPLETGQLQFPSGAIVIEKNMLLDVKNIRKYMKSRIKDLDKIKSVTDINKALKKNDTREFQLEVISFGSHTTLQDICDEFIYKRIQISLRPSYLQKINVAISHNHKKTGSRQEEVCEYFVEGKVRIWPANRIVRVDKLLLGQQYTIPEIGNVTLIKLSRAKGVELPGVSENFLVIVPVSMLDRLHQFDEMKWYQHALAINKFFLKNRLFQKNNINIIHFAFQKVNSGSFRLPAMQMIIRNKKGGGFIPVYNQMIWVQKMGLEMLTKKFSKQPLNLLVHIPSPTFSTFLKKKDILSEEEKRKLLDTGLKKEAEDVLNSFAKRDAEKLNLSSIIIHFGFQSLSSGRAAIMARFQKQGKQWHLQKNKPRSTQQDKIKKVIQNCATAGKEQIESCTWLIENYKPRMLSPLIPASAKEKIRKLLSFAHLARGRARRDEALTNNGQYTDAIADLSEAIKHNPKDPSALNARAWTYYKADMASKGLEDINKALQIAPHNPFYLDTRAHIYEAIGAKQKAIKSFKKALTIKPDLKESIEGLIRLGVKP